MKTSSLARYSSGQKLTRRSVIRTIAQAAAASSGLGFLQPASAKARNIPFGAAVEYEPFLNDARYRQALIDHTDMLVPMNKFKWALLRHTRGKFDFTGADEIIRFARKHGKSVRGHTLLWYAHNPQWVEEISTKKAAERALVEHIETVVDRYRGVVPSWDVVNEVVAHDPLSEGQWRQGLWLKHFGKEHVEIAFRAAARADPLAELVINDYDLENIGPRFEARRKAVLTIVRDLQDQNIPVHGVGLQAHLYAEREIDREGLARFIGKLGQLGVKTLVTELDVIDWRLSKNSVRRDIGAANVVAEFLEAVTAGGGAQSVVAWGITDRYSWISDVFKRHDGAPNRPLPLDRDYRQKPMFDVIDQFCRQL